MLAAESKVALPEAVRSPNGNANCSWKQIVEPVEPFLRAVTQQLVRQEQTFDPQIVPYAEHALNNGDALGRDRMLPALSRGFEPGFLRCIHQCAGL